MLQRCLFVSKVFILLSSLPGLHSTVLQPCTAPCFLFLISSHLIIGIGRKLSTEQFLSFKAAGGAADIKPWTSRTSWFDLLPSCMYLLSGTVTQAAACVLYQPHSSPGTEQELFPLLSAPHLCLCSQPCCLLVVCFFSAAEVCSSFSITCSDVILISCSISSPSPGKGMSAPGICPCLPL